MKFLLCVLSALLLSVACGKAKTSEPDSLIETARKEDTPKEEDTNTKKATTATVGGNCAATMRGSTLTYCLEVAVADKAKGQLFCGASGVGGTWTPDKSCNVPAGTKGCKTETKGDTLGTTMFSKDFDASSDCKGTVVKK